MQIFQFANKLIDILNIKRKKHPNTHRITQNHAKINHGAHLYGVIAMNYQMTGPAQLY